MAHPGAAQVHRGWTGGAVYGVAEGVLLSALPALIVWNAADTAGWTSGWGAGGSVLAPVIGHTVMPVAGFWNGIELPPHRHAGEGRALA